MSGIGHNRGPSMEPGMGFRKLSWSKARSALMPTLPLEVVRLRVARAKRLGLPYKTYASIRAASGRDVVAFLFSGNALDLRPGRIRVPAVQAARLTDLAADRLAAVYSPAAPEYVIEINAGLLDAAGRAPGFTAKWRAARDDLRALARARSLPLDGVVVVAATAIEQEWCGIAGLAGTIRADGFFSELPTD